MYLLYMAVLPLALHPHTPHTLMEEDKCTDGTTVTYVDDMSIIVYGKDQ